MIESHRTIIDLLDDFFGSSWTAQSIDRLVDREVEALAGDVDDFYRDYRVPDRTLGLVRTYSGGAAWFRNFELSPAPQKIAVSEALPFAYATVLYSHQVVFNCPLDAWVCDYRDYLQPGSFTALSGKIITPLASADTYGPGFRQSSLVDSRQRIGIAIEMLDTLAPAIRQGWLLPVPHLRLWKARLQQVKAAVRRDTINLGMYEAVTASYTSPPAVADNIRGFQIFPDEGIVPHDHSRAHVEGPSIYFNYALAVADAVDARFLPTADSDYSLLTQKVRQAADLRKSVRDGLAVNGLQVNELPTFDAETFETVCEIRRSEAAFDDWRKGIEALVQGELPTGSGNLDAVQSVVDERIAEYLNGIRLSVERSQTLKGRLEEAKAKGKELGADIGIAATIWSVPPQGSVLKLIAGVAAPLLRRALLSGAPDSSDKTASVVMKLDKRSRPGSAP